ncbi:MAG: methionine synthase [Ruminococcaceae bacterium]|nr:methionine synthase [Oscillospiraceae bacterium]
MTGDICMAVYSAPPINKKEILRYAGAREADASLAALLDECLALVDDGLSYRVAYAVYPVTKTAEGISLGFFTTSSRDLAKNLDRCHAVIAFGATVGHFIDRMVLREGVRSPAKALLLDALGTERVEALADVFCRDLAEKYTKEGCALRPRFSAGYGDLPLSVQTDVFRALALPKSLGVTLSNSLLMTPKKSVTAFVGIVMKEQV